MIKVGLSGLQHYQAQLQALGGSLERAGRGALYGAAKETVRLARQDKRVTRRSGRFNSGYRARINASRTWAGMESEAGGLYRAHKMVELGERETRGIRPGVGVGIPLDRARKGSSRKNKLTPANRLSRALPKTPKRLARGGTPKERNAKAMGMARKRGKRFAFLVLRGGGKRLGLFRVWRSKKRAPKLMWFTKRRVVSKPIPILENAAGKTQSKMRAIYIQNVRKEITRLGGIP